MKTNLLLRRCLRNAVASLLLAQPVLNAQVTPPNTRLVQLNTVKGSALSIVESTANFTYHVGTANSGEIGVDGLSATNIGVDDLFILKSNASTGSNMWLKTFNAGNGGIITPRYVSVDSSENLYVYGQFSGTITAGSTSATATGSSSSFLMKISSNGSAAWVNLLTGGHNVVYPKVKCVTDGTDTFIVYNQNYVARINDTNGNLVYNNQFNQTEVKSVALLNNSLYLAGATTDNGVMAGTETIPAKTGFILKGDKSGSFTASLKAAANSDTNYFGGWTDVSDIAISSDGAVVFSGFSKGSTSLISETSNYGYTYNPNPSQENNRIFNYVAKIDANLGAVAFFKTSSALSSDYIYGIQSRITHASVKPYGTTGNFRVIYTDNHFDGRNTINTFTNANGTTTTLTQSSTGGNVYKVLLSFNSSGAAPSALQPFTNGLVSSVGNNYSLSIVTARLFSTTVHDGLSGAAIWSKEKTNSISGSLVHVFQQNLNLSKDQLFVTSVVEGKANFFGKQVDNGSGVSARHFARLRADGLPMWHAQFHPDSGTRELNVSSDFAAVDKDDNLLMLANTSGATSIFTDAAGNTASFNQNALISTKVIIKTNKDGHFMWSKQLIPAQAAIISAAITADGNGDVHVVGITNQSFTVDGNTVSGTVSGNIFILKFSASGNLLYSKSYPNVGAYSLLPVLDAQHTLYLLTEPVNHTGNNYVFDGVTIPANPDYMDHLMLKFNSSGNVTAGKNFYANQPAGSTGYSWPNDIVFDGENFILMGSYYSISNTDTNFNGLDMAAVPKVYSPETHIPFLAKVKTDGSVMWQIPLHSNNSNTSAYTNISLDENKNIYMYGYVKDKMSVNGTEYLFDANTGNKILLKLDTDGSLKYSKVVDSGMNNYPMLSVFGNDKVNVSSFTSASTILNYPVNFNRASNFYIATFGNLDTKYLTPTKEYLELTNLEISNNPDNANTFSFDIINNVNWTANSDTSWLNLSYLSLTGKHDFKNSISGNGDAKLIMSAQTNTTGVNRTANVLVSGDSGVSPKTIAITQSAVLASGENKTFVTTLYPNPTSDILYIDTKQRISKIEIFDMSGRLLKTADGKDKKVSVAQLNKGTYLILIHTENGVVNSKFIKK